MLRVIEEDKEFSNYIDRLSSLINYFNKSQCPISTTEKGKGKEYTRNRYISVIKNIKGFTYKNFEDESKNQLYTLYNNII